MEIFHKMTAGGHFGLPKITFDRISQNFRSICNFPFFEKNSQNGRRRPFWIAEIHFRSLLKKNIFTIWPPAAINRKSLSIAILAISDLYATFLLLTFLTKCPPAAILDYQNHFRSHFSPFQINTQLSIFEQISQNGRRRPFSMTENHFQSHFSPFQINAPLLYCLSIFHKLAAGGHFGWPKITFDCISRHFRSIRNIFYFIVKMDASGHFGFQFLPKSIGTSLYSWSLTTSSIKLVGSVLIKLWSAQAFSSYFHKMASGHFGSSDFLQNR